MEILTRELELEIVGTTVGATIEAMEAQFGAFAAEVDNLDETTSPELKEHAVNIGREKKNSLKDYESTGHD